MSARGVRALHVSQRARGLRQLQLLLQVQMLLLRLPARRHLRLSA